MDSRELKYKLQVGRALLATGIAKPDRIDRTVRSLAALRRWGPSSPAAYLGGAARFPDRAAIVDDRGAETFRDVDARTTALASSLADAGIDEHASVAIMCRNHRGFIEATVACAKLGAGALYLNTAFAGPQITDVLAREDPAAVIYDEEFAGLVGAGAAGRKCYVARSERSRPGEAQTLADLIATGSTAELRPPAEKGRVVILTSGTTGTPKGAARKQPDTLEPAAALFSKIPLKARETTVIAAPLFHSWGYAHFTLGLALSSTLVLRN
ncbi:MAG TPA: AMP-binding protein, partial [Solirubrobacteraceae bacterium]|nr:AMP-binding protein [Solirubrobacteraceae bacterium]